tara:strand:+ start:17965 stop:18285 length:321 start_codon:yes stop_codon:yes gene_type:complete
MIKWFVFLLTLCFSFSTLAQQQQNGPVCADAKIMREKITKEHKEIVAFTGLTNNGKAVLEIFVNEETRKWTLIGTKPDGISCVISHGSVYDFVKGELVPEKSGFTL